MPASIYIRNHLKHSSDVFRTLCDVTFIRVMPWQSIISHMVEGDSLGPFLEYPVSKEHRQSCDKWGQAVLSREFRYPAALHVLCKKCLGKYLAHQFRMWRYQICKRKIDATLSHHSRYLSHFQYGICLLVEASPSDFNSSLLQIWTSDIWQLKKWRIFVASRGKYDRTGALVVPVIGR
jgi:hypothetical protein